MDGCYYNDNEKSRQIIFYQLVMVYNNYRYQFEVKNIFTKKYSARFYQSDKYSKFPRNGDRRRKKRGYNKNIRNPLP